MKLLFVNNAYPKEFFEQMRFEARGILQVPSNVFQWAIIEGLECCRADYELATVPALPAWPRNRRLFTLNGDMLVKGNKKGRFLRYCDAPIIKQISQRKVLHRYVQDWCKRNCQEENLYVLVYTPQSEYIKAIVELKKSYTNLHVASIVTDLIDDAMCFESNRRFWKRIQVWFEYHAEHRLYSLIDNFVLLTRAMEEKIPEAVGHNIIIEGIAPFTNTVMPLGMKDYKVRTLLYTGVLEEYACVPLLVNAFCQTTNRSFRLIICGSGTASEYIRQKAEEDNRIIFLGRVNHEEVIRLQNEATVLINPRQPNGRITKYSFPSKTMEYMTSGTPMIGYRLEGIPKEYYSYMFTPDDLSIQALSQCIDYTLNLSQAELNNRAEAAFNFIMQQKTPQTQITKILDFLQN